MPRSLPWKTHPRNMEPLGLFHIKSAPIPSKITKCYHTQSPQAWLARQHHVLQERTRKVLNFKIQCTEFQIREQSRQEALSAVPKGRILGRELCPQSDSRSSWRGQADLSPICSAGGSSGWIAGEGVEATPFLLHPCKQLNPLRCYWPNPGWSVQGQSHLQLSAWALKPSQHRDKPNPTPAQAKQSHRQHSKRCWGWILRCHLQPQEEVPRSCSMPQALQDVWEQSSSQPAKAHMGQAPKVEISAAFFCPWLHGSEIPHEVPHVLEHRVSVLWVVSLLKPGVR